MRGTRVPRANARAALRPVLQGRQGGGPRIDLADGNSLSCYRRVAVEDLLAHREGIYYEVSFDEPDFLRCKTRRDKVRCITSEVTSEAQPTDVKWF